MDKSAKPTAVGNKCEHCGTDIYAISGGFWVHTLNGSRCCPAKSAPSKESLERARNWMTHNLSDWDSAEAEWLALEFDAIRRERDEAADKLAEEVAQYAERKGEGWRVGEGTEIMDALAAYRERMGR